MPTKFNLCGKKPVDASEASGLPNPYQHGCTLNKGPYMKSGIAAKCRCQLPFRDGHAQTFLIIQAGRSPRLHLVGLIGLTHVTV